MSKDEEEDDEGWKRNGLMRKRGNFEILVNEMCLTILTNRGGGGILSI